MFKEKLFCLSTVIQCYYSQSRSLRAITAKYSFLHLYKIQFDANEIFIVTPVHIFLLSSNGKSCFYTSSFFCVQTRCLVTSADGTPHFYHKYGAVPSPDTLLDSQ